MQVLRIDDILKPGDIAHIARVRFSGHDGVSPHTHEFAEIFWIEEGQCLFGEDDRRTIATPGFACVALPEDQHGFSVPARKSGQASFVMVNVAFRPEPLLEALRRHHPLFDPKDRRRMELGPEGARALSASFERLVRSGPSALGLDRFILDTLERINEADRRQGDTALPDWLDEAVDRLLHRELPLEKPVEELAAIAGRSREHVSRTIRAQLGLSASEYLRTRMLDKAAALLALDAGDVGTIADIAARSGFSNLGGFYRSFRATRGLAPAAFRDRVRKNALPQAARPVR